MADFSVSVIMTCHNEAGFIEQAIRSVAEQTAFDLVCEIIVVDDDSTDESAVLLDRLAAEIPKLSLLRATGVGLPAARNLALSRAKGTHIAILDGDDFWVPEKIERQMAAFVAAPDIGLVYSDFVDFSAPDAADAQLITVRRYQSSERSVLAEYFVHDAPVVPSTAIIPKKVFDDVGVFDPVLRLGEDTEMFLRIAERWKFQHVPGGLVYKRRHGKNLTSRLDRLLPVAMEATRKFVNRNPELQPLAGRRMARRYASAGNSCVALGEWMRATRFLFTAIRHDPFYWRSYVYLVVSLVPFRFDRLVRRGLRAIYHGVAKPRIPTR